MFSKISVFSILIASCVTLTLSAKPIPKRQVEIEKLSGVSEHLTPNLRNRIEAAQKQGKKEIDVVDIETPKDWKFNAAKAKAIDPELAAEWSKASVEKKRALELAYLIKHPFEASKEGKSTVQSASPFAPQVDELLKGDPNRTKLVAAFDAIRTDGSIPEDQKEAVLNALQGKIVQAFDMQASSDKFKIGTAFANIAEIAARTKKFLELANKSEKPNLKAVGSADTTKKNVFADHSGGKDGQEKASDRKVADGATDKDAAKVKAKVGAAEAEAVISEMPLDKSGAVDERFAGIMDTFTKGDKSEVAAAVTEMSKFTKEVLESEEYRKASPAKREEIEAEAWAKKVGDKNAKKEFCAKCAKQMGASAAANCPIAL